MKVFIWIIFAYVMTSCVTYKKCQKKFSTGVIVDTLIIKDTLRIPVEFYVPPDSLAIFMHMSDFINLKDTLTVFSKDSNVVTKISIDRNDNVSIQTRVKERIIRDTIVKEIEVKGVCPPCEQFQDNSLKASFIEHWQFFLILIIISGFSGFYFGFKLASNRNKSN